MLFIVTEDLHQLSSRQCLILAVVTKVLLPSNQAYQANGHLCKGDSPLVDSGEALLKQ